jgi:lysophospholipase L1-like esterase
MTVARVAKAAVLGSVVLAMCGGLAEGLLRLLSPVNTRYMAIPPNLDMLWSPTSVSMPGVNGRSRYQTSSMGIRGVEFDSLDRYRILAIGGSTTENLYLDQDETWTLRVGAALNALPGAPKIWMGDVGRSGHTSRSHLLHVRHLPPQLPKISAVVMLVGVNDLTVALRQGFDFVPSPPLTNPDAERAQRRAAFYQVPGPSYASLTTYQRGDVRWYKRTALYQYARAATFALDKGRASRQQDESGTGYTQWRLHRRASHQRIDSLPDLTAALAEYKATLAAIVRTARAQNLRLVLLTQPTLWRAGLSEREQSLLWLGGVGPFQEEPGHSYFTPEALARAMDAYNDVLLAVCAAHRVECVDLARQVPKDSLHFFDDVHFTERGSARVAEVVASYFASLPPFKPND